MTKLLNKYKMYYNYSKQYGDTDIQVIYFNKIKDLLSQEIYGEFGYETCSMVENEKCSRKKEICNLKRYGR